ncbi:MAG: hypothetical protein A2579_08240 [Lysobacterales bacterium RIFOXYD1_FULL_69_11]|nr:MAG: hypothetical protein A2190_05980 [Xanthomonadales bacterium RIFOXYA1_FULL_69_10]OHE87305.1 MAG: hypothetical protein A2579_08240 [Xanthomonadales bacterium RIFOXYD1_FULL_69_11]
MPDDNRPAGGQPARLTWAWLPVAAVIVAMFYPGIMSNDSHASLEQARTLQFTSWHPPIMALVWAVLDRIVEGPALMLVAQAVLYATACARLCMEALPRLVERWSAWVVVPLFGLFPPAMTLNGMIWKDVWMSGLLLFAVAYLFRMANTTQQHVRVRAFAILLLCCLLATAFRHNAIAATAGLLAGGVYYLWPHRHRGWQLLRACIGGVVLAVVLLVPVTALNRLVAKPAHVTTPILMHDIAGIIVNADEPWRAARLALSAAPNLTDQSAREFTRGIKKHYSPAAAARMVRTTRRPDAPFAINVYKLDHDAESVKRAWQTLLRRYPRAYLTHRLDTFACLMQLCEMEQWKIHSYVLNKEYVAVTADGWLQPALRRTFGSEMFARAYIPAGWLLFLVLLAATDTLMRRKNTITLFLALSGVGLASSLLLTSPIESYRYVHWAVLIAWSSLALVIERRYVSPAHITKRAQT